MDKKSFLVALAVVLVGSYWLSGRQKPKEEVKPEYDPKVVSTEFVEVIDNKYFTLKPGSKFAYSKKEGKDTEKIEIEVLGEKKEIMGIKTTAVHDRVWLNGVMIEDTYDWYAQDKAGNVWYFGEKVDNYKEGKVVDNKGSWLAGENGARPGIVMKASPQPGESYRQEYAKGEAEDMADVVAVDLKVTVGKKVWQGCLKTRDWSLIDSSLNEYKYYCPEVGFWVMEEAVSGEGARTEIMVK